MSNLKDIKIVFFGTPEFAVASLDALLKAGANIAAVVTMPDKPAGRGHKLLQSDVKKYALAEGLPVLQPVNLKSDEFVAQLKEIDADLFIVIAFRMLPEVVWSMPPMGTFNLHASLLPDYRGAAPINRAVMNGDTRTGVTTFMLKHEIDTGDILSQREIEILPEDNVGDVHDRLMSIGADEVVRTVEMIAEGSAHPIPQPAGEFTPAPKIFKDDCKIRWENPAIKIHNQVRGLSPYPAAFTEFVDENGKTLTVKIFKTTVIEGKGHGKPGDVCIENKRIFVNAGNNSAIEIIELQPAGKKRMSAEAFLAGNSLKYCS